MADQANDSGAENTPETGTSGTPQAPGSARPADPGKGDDPDGLTKADKAEAMEDVQRDAAKEREENRGYQ